MTVSVLSVPVPVDLEMMNGGSKPPSREDESVTLRYWYDLVLIARGRVGITFEFMISPIPLLCRARPY